MNTNSQKPTTLSYVDNVFIELGQAPLLENKYFVSSENDYFIPSENSVPNSHAFELKKVGRPYLLFIIHEDSLEIVLDRIPEAYEWLITHVAENVSAFKKTLKEILTSRIHIKRVGPNITRVTMFDQNGDVVQKWSDYRNIPLSFKTTEKLYDPIFPMKE